MSHFWSRWLKCMNQTFSCPERRTTLTHGGRFCDKDETESCKFRLLQGRTWRSRNMTVDVGSSA